MTVPAAHLKGKQMKLSVLDQSTAAQGQPQGDAIRESLELARHCDALGYHRYWVSEHHNSDSIVGTAPEVLMAAIAATTTRIRVGSAGVMLPHYSALKVAEQFRVLEGIAPGRIDLGVGRAPGSDRLTAFALNPYSNAAAEFPQQVHDLQAWVSGAALPKDHPFSAIAAHPRGATSPELWILGSSDYGARLAAHFGLPYAFAYFFTEGKGVEQALDLYRRNYRPSPRYPEPQATICVWALAADTEAEAKRLLRTREFWRVGFEQGLRTPLVTPEVAAAHFYTETERASIEALRRVAMVGTAQQVATRLNELAQRLALNEIVINTWTHDPSPRHRSYELLADAFELRSARRPSGHRRYADRSSSLTVISAMVFVPQITPPAVIDQARWLLFQDRRLLVRAESVELPRLSDPAVLGIAVQRPIFVGSLDGEPCFSAEVEDGSPAPDNFRWEGLRALFMRADDAFIAAASRAVQLVDWDRDHQFCGRCATPSLHNGHERSRACPNCGLVAYPRISPAMMALVKRGRELLLARSTRFPDALFSALAGFVEAGESIEDTVRREVREEVGVEVENLRYFGSQSWPFPNSLMIGYVCDYTGGEIVPEEGEIAEAAWFDVDALPHIPPTISIAGRMIRAVAEELRRIR